MTASHRRRRGGLGALCATLLACLVLPPAALLGLRADRAQNTGSEATTPDRPAPDGPIAAGERLYHIHCLNCHGEQGRGDGPMTEVLKTRVPDLTLIAAHHGGEFPAEQVRQSIDGRFPVRAHGLREMPVWGLSFRVRGRDRDEEREVQTRLGELVAYLESVQRQE